MTIYDVLRRPLVTEKGVAKKENERTLCFEVAVDATKTQVKAAVEKLFKVKVAEVRTSNLEGKLRRRGRFAGYRPSWKKAYVRLKAGEGEPGKPLARGSGSTKKHAEQDAARRALARLMNEAADADEEEHETA